MVPAAMKSILIVDDEPLVLQTMEMLLAFDGHRVETAHAYPVVSARH